MKTCACNQSFSMVFRHYTKSTFIRRNIENGFSIILVIYLKISEKLLMIWNLQKVYKLQYPHAMQDTWLDTGPCIFSRFGAIDVFVVFLQKNICYMSMSNE